MFTYLLSSNGPVDVVAPKKQFRSLQNVSVLGFVVSDYQSLTSWLVFVF